MSVRSDIKTRLTGDATITTLVGNQVYWVLRPVTTTGSCIIIRRVGTTFSHDLDGTIKEESGAFQFRCVARASVDADTIAAAVKARIQGNGGTWTATTVYSCLLQDEFDDIEPPIDGGSDPYCVTVVTYQIQTKD